MALVNCGSVTMQRDSKRGRMGPDGKSKAQTGSGQGGAETDADISRKPEGGKNGSEIRQGTVRLRLYVGGLGPSVSSSDLQQRFAPLGCVHQIQIVPCKFGEGSHRGFAYVEFEASSEASLRYLFSVYNGCKWKGGCLRVEKAKEHYLDRLHQEWAAQAKASSDPSQADSAASLLGSAIGKPPNGPTTLSIQREPLKIAIPNSKKVKLVPAKGLGKHKYSFQAFESLPLCLLTRELSPPRSSKRQKLEDSEGKAKDVDPIAAVVAEERNKQLQLLRKLFPDEEVNIRKEAEQALVSGSVEGKVHSFDAAYKRQGDSDTGAPFSNVSDDLALDGDDQASKHNMERDNEKTGRHALSPVPLKTSKRGKLFQVSTGVDGTGAEESLLGTNWSEIIFSGILDDMAVDGDDLLPLPNLEQGSSVQKDVQTHRRNSPIPGTSGCVPQASKWENLFQAAMGSDGTQAEPFPSPKSEFSSVFEEIGLDVDDPVLQPQAPLVQVDVNDGRNIPNTVQTTTDSMAKWEKLFQAATVVESDGEEETLSGSERSEEIQLIENEDAQVGPVVQHDQEGSVPSSKSTRTSEVVGASTIEPGGKSTESRQMEEGGIKMDKVGSQEPEKGANWVQSASWKSLVGENSRVAFSLKSLNSLPVGGQHLDRGGKNKQQLEEKPEPAWTFNFGKSTQEPGATQKFSVDKARDGFPTAAKKPVSGIQSRASLPSLVEYDQVGPVVQHDQEGSVPSGKSTQTSEVVGASTIEPGGKSTESRQMEEVGITMDKVGSQEPEKGANWVQRASWKSLVGEDGRVAFSLKSLNILPVVDQNLDTGDKNKQQPEEKPEPAWTFNFGKSTHEPGAFRKFSVDKARVSFPIAAKKRVSGIERRASLPSRVENSSGLSPSISLGAKPATSTVQKAGVLETESGSSDQAKAHAKACLFMKSATAEEEWLASKSQLRADSRTKHKAAVRTMRKLRGPLGGRG